MMLTWLPLTLSSFVLGVAQLGIPQQNDGHFPLSLMNPPSIADLVFSAETHWYTNYFRFSSSGRSFVIKKAANLRALFANEALGPTLVAGRLGPTCWYANNGLIRYASVTESVVWTNIFGQFYNGVFLNEVRAVLNLGIPGTEIGHSIPTNGTLVSEDALFGHVRSVLIPSKVENGRIIESTIATRWSTTNQYYSVLYSYGDRPNIPPDFPDTIEIRIIDDQVQLPHARYHILRYKPVYGDFALSGADFRSNSLTTNLNAVQRFTNNVFIHDASFSPNTANRIRPPDLLLAFYYLLSSFALWCALRNTAITNHQNRIRKEYVC